MIEGSNCRGNLRILEHKPEKMQRHTKHLSFINIAETSNLSAVITADEIKNAFDAIQVKYPGLDTSKKGVERRKAYRLRAAEQIIKMEKRIRDERQKFNDVNAIRGNF